MDFIVVVATKPSQTQATCNISLDVLPLILSILDKLSNTFIVRYNKVMYTMEEVIHQKRMKMMVCATLIYILLA